MSDSNDELAGYRENLIWELERVVECAIDAQEDVMGLRPDATDANSLAGIASHALGAAQEHVLGWVLRRTLDPDVDRFDDSATAMELRARSEAVVAELQLAFEEIAQLSLEQKVSTPGRGEQSIRAVLMWAMLHAAEHAGAAELTRDVILARRQE